MGSHKRSGRSTPAPPRSSTAPPERSHRSSRRNAPALAPLDESYEPQEGGFPQESSGSRPFATFSDLYEHVVSTGGPDDQSSSSKHRKKKSSHRSGTPKPESYSSRQGSGSQGAWAPPGGWAPAPSYGGSSFAGPSVAGPSFAPPPNADPQWYSDTVDQAEAAAMQNTHLYGGDGSLNPMLAPFVAAGVEGEDQVEPQQFCSSFLFRCYTTPSGNVLRADARLSGSFGAPSTSIEVKTKVEASEHDLKEAKVLEQVVQLDPRW